MTFNLQCTTQVREWIVKKKIPEIFTSQTSEAHEHEQSEAKKKLVSWDTAQQPQKILTWHR